MSTASTNLIFGILMVLAGIGIPIMAALNGGLGARLASPAAASPITVQRAIGIALMIGGVFLARKVG